MNPAGRGVEHPAAARGNGRVARADRTGGEVERVAIGITGVAEQRRQPDLDAQQMIATEGDIARTGGVLITWLGLKLLVLPVKLLSPTDSAMMV